MKLMQGDVAIVSEVDAANMLVKVQWPTSNVVSSWLMVVSQHYWMPEINDQVVCFYDKNRRQGVAFGIVRKEGDAPYDDADTVGINLGTAELFISKSTGKITVISNEEVNVQAKTISLEAEKVTVSQELIVEGNITAKAKIDATGIIKSQADVQTLTVKLNTHMHPTAGTGPPSPPIQTP